MKQLTIRGFDKELERRLRELAQREGLSLNQAALRLLQKGAGLGVSAARPVGVGDSLDHLIGSWTAKDEKDFLEAVEVFEQIDESLWK